jgi:hypothetical protein
LRVARYGFGGHKVDKRNPLAAQRGMRPSLKRSVQNMSAQAWHTPEERTRPKVPGCATFSRETVHTIYGPQIPLSDGISAQ